MLGYRCRVSQIVSVIKIYNGYMGKALWSVSKLTLKESGEHFREEMTV